MAWYRWNKSAVNFSPKNSLVDSYQIQTSLNRIYGSPGYTFQNGVYVLDGSPGWTGVTNLQEQQLSYGYYYTVDSPSGTTMFHGNDVGVYVRRDGSQLTFREKESGYNLEVHTVNTAGGGFIEYVYSTDPSAYPENGASGGYWYSDRTEMLPSAPGSITVPMATAGQQCTITWTAATASHGTIASYTLERSVNGSGWTQVFSGNALTYTDTIGQDWATVAYRVCAVDDAGGAGPYATSEAQTVQDGILYISGPAADMGGKTAPFAFAISTGVSGSEAVVTDIAVKISLDGNQVYSGMVSTGQEISVTIDIRTIGGGSHTIEATASKTDYVAASESYTFSTPSISLPSGGLGVQLQDDQGRPVFPQGIASLIGGLYGQSVAGNLQQLAKSVLYNRIATPKYQEVTVDLSTAQEGDIVQLPENGVMVDFYVAKHDYESSLNGAGRTLLVRKDCYDTRVWEANGSNTFPTSDIYKWLNGTYKGLFPSDMQSAMGATEFRYTPGFTTVTVSTTEASVFLLSLTELGLNPAYANVEGSKLPISDLLHIAYLNGAAVSQWTRSPYTNTSESLYDLWYLDTGGAPINTQSTHTAGARPCFTLPSTFSATYYVGPDGIHDAQEYTEGGTYTDLLGNDIPVPKIETGSYVGTGTTGSANPSTLTFSFVPKIWGVTTEVDPTTLQIINNGIIMVWGRNSTDGYKNLLYYGLDGVATWDSLLYDNRTVSWYAVNSAIQQFNQSGHRYYYYAIGIDGED